MVPPYCRYPLVSKVIVFHTSADRTENRAKQIDRDETKLSGVAVLLRTDLSSQLAVIQYPRFNERC
jgi:hypothetical protein